MGRRGWLARGPVPEPAFSRLREEAPADHARRLLATGAEAGAPSRYGAGARLARRLIARLTRHERRHQQAVVEAVLASADQSSADMHARIDGLAGALDRLSRSFDDADTRMAAVETRLAALLDGTGQSPARTPADLAETADHCRDRLATAWPRNQASDTVASVRPAPVRVATDVGSLLFPAGDDFITPYVEQHGHWEKEECAELLAFLRPGMTFVDIGAHVGYLTLVAAGAVGPSGFGVALEPEETNYTLLCANLLARGIDNVVPLRAAAWAETTAVTLGVSSYNSGDHRAYAGGSAGRAPVVGLALDDVIPADAPIDVVKIDTQGRDHLAIEGMQRTLSRTRPILMVEFWPPGITEVGDDPLAVLQRYRSLGLDVSLLGTSTPASDESVMAAAASSAGDYCTIVLRPVS